MRRQMVTTMYNNQWYSSVIAREDSLHFKRTFTIIATKTELFENALKPREYENDSFSCSRARKRWRHDDHAISLTEFSSNTNPKWAVFAAFLRASSCKYGEWDDSRKISDFFIFCPNNLYSEWSSEIPFKGSEALQFFRNRGKFENRHFSCQTRPKMAENCAFSFRSYRSTR